MILITVELISAITGERSVLGTAKICNDAQRTIQTDGVLGDYVCELRGKHDRLMQCCRVERFPRKRRHAWDLLYRCLDTMLGSRNK